MHVALTPKGERHAHAAAARALLDEIRREARAEQSAAEREAALTRRQAIARDVRLRDRGAAPAASAASAASAELG